MTNYNFTFEQLRNLLISMTRGKSCVITGISPLKQFYCDTRYCTHVNKVEYITGTTPGLGIDAAYHFWSIGAANNLIVSVPSSWYKVTHNGAPSWTAPQHWLDVGVADSTQVTLNNCSFVAPKVDWSSAASLQAYIEPFLADPKKTQQQYLWKYNSAKKVEISPLRMNDLGQNVTPFYKSNRRKRLSGRHL